MDKCTSIAKRIGYKESHNNPFVIMLFCVLPIIDTLNGIYPEIPIGKIYKMSLGIVVFTYLCVKKRKLNKKKSLVVLGTFIYVFFSIAINALLGGNILNIEYPIKLLFNVLLFVSLVQCTEYKLVCGEDFYCILEYGAWFFVCCYIIPYFLGVGNKVYAGDIGYKAFFIAQNELGLVIVVFCFFTAYQLINRSTIINVLKLASLLICGLLLNTKTAIIASIIAVIMWFVPIIINGRKEYKILTFIVIIVGVIVLKETMINSFKLVYDRFSMLTTKYYNGSIITGILSGRNNTVVAAWNDLVKNHFFVRFLIGNGFCSKLLVEMDLIDIFFFLGIIGVAFTSAWLYRIYAIIKCNSKYDKSRIKKVSYLVILVLLFFAGHVLFMAMSGCYFIVYLCFLIYYKD